MTDNVTESKTPKTLIATSELKQSLKLLLSGTGTDQALEGADSILFSGGAAHVFNGQVSVSVPLKDTDENPIPLHGALKAKTFSAWVSKVKADTISFETLADGSWEITAGKSQINPTRFEDAISKNIEALDLASLEWQDLPEGFHGAMLLVRLDNQKSSVPLVVFSGSTAMATDGMRFNSADFDYDFGDFAVHTDDLKAVLQSSDLRQIAVRTGWVHFLTESGIVWTVGRRDSSAYRKDVHNNILKFVEGSIEAKTEGNIETELPVGLADAVDKLEVYAQSDKESGTVRVDLKINSAGLSLWASRTEGKARESLEWPEPLPEGVDHEMAVSGPFLKEAAARNLKLHVVKVDFRGTQSTQIAFKGGNFTQVVKAIAKAGA